MGLLRGQGVDPQRPCQPPATSVAGPPSEHSSTDTPSCSPPRLDRSLPARCLKGISSLQPGNCRKPVEFARVREPTSAKLLLPPGPSPLLPRWTAELPSTCCRSAAVADASCRASLRRASRPLAGELVEFKSAESPLEPASMLRSCPSALGVTVEDPVPPLTLPPTV